MMTNDDIDVKDLFEAMKALGAAVLGLKKCRDLMLAAGLNTMAAASVHLLHEAAHGVLNELGTKLREIRQTSTDPETQATLDVIFTYMGVPGSDPVARVASE